jgi:hypothetical protein
MRCDALFRSKSCGLGIGSVFVDNGRRFVIDREFLSELGNRWGEDGNTCNNKKAEKLQRFIFQLELKYI